MTERILDVDLLGLPYKDLGAFRNGNTGYFRYFNGELSYDCRVNGRRAVPSENNLGELRPLFLVKEISAAVLEFFLHLFVDLIDHHHRFFPDPQLTEIRRHDSSLSPPTGHRGLSFPVPASPFPAVQP